MFPRVLLFPGLTDLPDKNPSESVARTVGNDLSFSSVTINCKYQYFPVMSRPYVRIKPIQRKADLRDKESAKDIFEQLYLARPNEGLLVCFQYEPIM